MDTLIQTDLFGLAADKKQTNRPRNDVRIGDAGEDFVMAKLKKWGFDAHRCAAGGPYDIVVDVDGLMLRVQIKTTGRVSRQMSFSFTRGFHGSKRGVYGYEPTDFDISATCNLADEKVLFAPGVHKSISWPRAAFLRENAELDSWLTAIATFKHQAA
jgi:hypothetical protein